MYFEVENTPEHIRKARRKEVLPKRSPKEKCPRLVLAPFSRPPQVVFENVLIGTSCEKNLEVLNPSKQVQQITLGKAIPHGLVIDIPGECLTLEPETCYCLTMLWTPTQPTALRDTIRFTNENRGRYDVIVVLKSVMNIKGNGKLKGFKTSPGKIKKKVSKRSPVAVYKKRAEIIYNTTQIKRSVSVVQTIDHKVYSSNKENNSTFNDYSMEYHLKKCPFDSPTSVDLNFNTSEIFQNMRKERNCDAILQNTYEMSSTNSNNQKLKNNILKPSNKQTFDNSTTDIFENLTFTPLKSVPSEKLSMGPKIIFSVNSDTDIEDSFEINNENKENVTHSITSVTSVPTYKRHLNLPTKHDNVYTETTTNQNMKIPNTSSPKELHSPNFSINTELSRISDLSFCPQRFSTERKMWPKINNETHDIVEDVQKFHSDTYTKESPNTPMEHHMNEMYMDPKPPHFFVRDPKPKLCRQSLFREYQQARDNYDRNYLNACENNVWQNNLRSNVKSPPRSLTPPLQSIPEESMHMTYSHFDKGHKPTDTFTINRTFDKEENIGATSTAKESWSKKAIRMEPELWKIPAPVPRKSFKSKHSIKSKESLGGKISNVTFNSNKSLQNVSLNYIGNVYSQSFTVDPFMSSTYYYDEEAVHKFEKEFIQWLNCILTPPAELDSNEEQTIDVGKAWIENRNKEIPAAPTKEQVSSAYHSSHRLESLRRSAKALLMSPEIAQVYQKLNAQIEKKLIAIRTDKNLHLDIGLQKIIMEILLSYNPLWLRIGLEAIYRVVLPLKSNNDIEGLTLFIIQRMFKNPYLKGKTSKSNTPNVLHPSYMEAIKKFTLKKFFMLVFFLDQAKQKKIIAHDPCLFRRNAVCKESREIVFRFTRELIAGIGDITKHLRPLGYVVCHKQSYLDEYKYAVHNLAMDIRDGVRLTKVMEIILMKNGLLSQLRTPAISRMQKIHNVQVALNALKEVNFVIVGDITAKDIADGHREKTLSLLWQLIHVFRAPLFEKAANVIQTWWRKKYEVIVEKRKEEERVKQKQNNAASAIQCWWRRIQYNRLVEWKMYQVTTATLVIQKYFRMWSCRSRLRKVKRSVLKIENWYISIKLMREARNKLESLKTERQMLVNKSATLIQSYIRRWLCMERYKKEVNKIVRVQSIIRCYLAMKYYNKLRKSVIFIQKKYKGKLLMKAEIQRLLKQKQSAIIIQKYYRMTIQLRLFRKLKKTVLYIEELYIAKLKMRNQRQEFVKMRNTAIFLQSLYRGKKCRMEYIRHRNLIIYLQAKIRAYLLMKKQRISYIEIKKAIILIQKRVKSYLAMKRARQSFILQRNSAIKIQKHYRAYKLLLTQRYSYNKLRSSTISIQNWYRSVLLMRKDKSEFEKLKNAAIVIQKQYRAFVSMKYCKENYQNLRLATIVMQRRFRAQMKMRFERSQYLLLRKSCVIMQQAYRAYRAGKQQRLIFLQYRSAAIKIQIWYQNCRKSRQVRQQFRQSKQACVVIQNVFRAYVIGKRERQQFIKIRTATVNIQRYYRAYVEMKVVRQQYIKIKTSTVTIQRFYRSYTEIRKQREAYLKVRAATILIQTYYSRYKESKSIRQTYCNIRNATICIQRRYKGFLQMKKDRNQFLELKQSVLSIQQRYRALIAMKTQRLYYTKLQSAAITIQRRFRAQQLMKKNRTDYIKCRQSCLYIQQFYRAYKDGNYQRDTYLKLKQSTILLQTKYKALLSMRKERALYKSMLSASIIIQRRWRAQYLMREERNRYKTIRKACLKIQRYYRTRKVAKQHREQYLKLKNSAIILQRRYRALLQMRRDRLLYLRNRSALIAVQKRFRFLRFRRRNEAASKIQIWFRSAQKGRECRREFLKIIKSVILIQTTFRKYVAQKKYQEIMKASIAIQRWYRSYKIASKYRKAYVNKKMSITRIQSYIRCFIERKRYLRIQSAVKTIQAVYRFKRSREILKKQRETAAICIQKHVRRYLAESWYKNYRLRLMYIQKIWRGKLVTRLMRCEYLQKRSTVIKLQAAVRGFLTRKYIQRQRVMLLEKKELQRQYWAASKIQALFRGNRERVRMAENVSVAILRRRWKNGALLSTQQSLKERNDEAMDVLRNMSDIETVINAFRSLELLTEVVPMMYNEHASAIVRRIYVYMSVTNRSISSIEVLRSAASILVNLTRYHITGPKIYARDRISPILKYMLRFSNTETHLFCVLSTYLWLFSKYEVVKEDLKEFLHVPENHKMLITIEANITRMKRMVKNTKNKFLTPLTSKVVSHTNHSICNQSVCNSKGNSSLILPAVEPDYGIMRIDKPHYFEDAQQAIKCLFHTYNL